MVAYFSVAMATAHGKPRLFGREEGKKKKPFTYLYRGKRLDERGWFLLYYVCSGSVGLNKMDSTGAPSQPRWATFPPQGQSTDGLSQEGVSCGGGGNWAQSWHGGAEPSACQDCSISDPCSGSPVFPPQMDSLQKGVSHAWAASQ